MKKKSLDSGNDKDVASRLERKTNKSLQKIIFNQSKLSKIKVLKIF